MGAVQDDWRLTPENAALVVVDVQERLMAAMPRRGEVVGAINRLLAAAGILNLPALVTLQYLKGLGPMCAELAETPLQIPPMEKLSFSCCGSTQFVKTLADLNRKRIILCGVEAHVCVQQTALDLLAGGSSVYVAADAVCSRRDHDYAIAIERMRTAGVIVSSAESVVFEMLREAGTAQFKQMLPLFK